MAFGNPILDFFSFDFLHSLLPDFIIAFAFFTALVFGVVGRRMGPGRPAIAVSAAMGLALSIGLVWWEMQTGISVRDLGPFAVGFAIMILAGVMFQAIRHIGGGWAGGMIALGASLLVGSIAGLRWPIDLQVIHTLISILLIVGVLVFLMHRRAFALRGSHPFSHDESADIRHDVSDLYEDRRTADWLGKGFRALKRKAEHLHERPQEASDVMVQLRRMLPAEGFLTERMARLREKAHRIRVGHIAQIEELQKRLSHLPPQARRKAASELAAKFKELKFDVRLERLDRAVAANEKHVRELTAQAQALLHRGDQRGLVDVLKAASVLQKHNAHLLRTISRTEKHLLQVAEHAAGKSGRVKAP